MVNSLNRAGKNITGTWVNLIQNDNSSKFKVKIATRYRIKDYLPNINPICT